MEGGVEGGTCRKKIREEGEGGWFVPVYTRYTLEVGELSEPVYTDSGIHIILRTA